MTSNTNISDNDYFQQMWNAWKSDPDSVPDDWRKLFSNWQSSSKLNQTSKNKELLAYDQFYSQSQSSNKYIILYHQLLLQKLYNNFRKYGHFIATTNPLKSSPCTDTEKKYSLTICQYPSNYTGLLSLSSSPSSNLELSFKDHFAKLKSIYTGSIGYDYDHIDDQEKLWFIDKIENKTHPQHLKHDYLSSFQWLAKACLFEQFLHKRFIGQKRFSLEGLDVILPILAEIANYGGDNLRLKELCLGMAHRGRLNILANFLGMSYEKIINTFDHSTTNSTAIDGDVRYHLGYVGNHLTKEKNNSLKLFLAPNPSHLESINPVLQGIVRGRQASLHIDQDPIISVLGVLIHGDAAFTGQGVVAESFNYSKLDGYDIGGTFHIIANNQIGFTTDPINSRTSEYCSDIAKSIKAPILHVNGDDPLACISATRLCLEYRQTFSKDIILDVIGYRKYGHNESDEPAFTQPLIYAKLKNHKNCYEQFKTKLLNQNNITNDQINSIENTTKLELENAFAKAKTNNNNHVCSVPKKNHDLPSCPYHNCFKADFVDASEFLTPIKTPTSKAKIKKALETLTSYPDDFNIHRKVKKVLDTRKKILNTKDHHQVIDWASAELIAFGSLMLDQYSIRLTGQDVSRGTFSSRHLIGFDSINNHPYCFLSPLESSKHSTNISSIEVINSPLSEYGCLGYEFGYSTVRNKSLVVFEAQFGDFINGAQIIIDQYIAASVDKWSQASSLVVLLPHGYEGQGSEHSSARPERFLQLCARNNFQVVYCSTPAQHFHVLIRQAKRSFNRCLIALTPKSLLRDPRVLSSMSNLCSDGFQELIDDQDHFFSKTNKTNQKSAMLQKMIFCSGKIYYQLKQACYDHDLKDKIAIVRIEQLYPFPLDQLTKTIDSYYQTNKDVDLVWVQEEPLNMGFWFFISPLFVSVLQQNFPKLVSKFRPISRPESASTAEGNPKSHALNQQAIITKALEL